MPKKKYGRLKLNKGDYTVICMLAVLLVIFTLYVYRQNRSVGKSSAANAATAPMVAMATLDSVSNDGVLDTVKPISNDPIRTAGYPGPPQRTAYITKLKEGERIDLNSSDTTALMKVPGIGSAFAHRIAKYRSFLGGFYCKEQLQEVYGMDRERYEKIVPFFVITTPVDSIYYDLDSVARHPYLNWKHKRAILKIVKEQPPLTWQKLMKEKVFTRDDSLRLASYLQIQ